MGVSGISGPNRGIAYPPVAPENPPKTSPEAPARNEGDSYCLVVPKEVNLSSISGGTHPFQSLIWSTPSGDIPSPPTEDLA
jgi:hypothetical protein